MRILIYEKGWGPNNNVFLYNAKLHHFDFDFGNDTLDTSLYMCTQTKYFLI